MQKFIQKYTIVHTINYFPDGYEFSMEAWPIHVSLADVFSIQGSPNALLEMLSNELSNYLIIESQVIGEDWFGEDKTVNVMLINKSDKLQSLHETIIDVLEKFHVIFNAPQFTLEGFTPHSTVKGKERLHVGDTVYFNSVTLIDMFPNKNPYRRKVLGTIHFSE
ncbi:MAG TPA: 2'-5' RNA ligase family protein [Candidatus Angelobacter sp.]|nr:2'-5' RNA ligase family protein [Candidatus Angelobacter sp.]